MPQCGAFWQKQTGKTVQSNKREVNFLNSPPSFEKFLPPFLTGAHPSKDRARACMGGVFAKWN